jgi:hypothetical protein
MRALKGKKTQKDGSLNKRKIPRKSIATETE